MKSDYGRLALLCAPHSLTYDWRIWTRSYHIWFINIFRDKKTTFMHPQQSFITWVWLSNIHSEPDSLFFTNLFLTVFIFFLYPTYLSLSIASFSCFLYLLIFISLSLNSALYTLLFSTSNLLQFLLLCTPYRKTVSPKMWGSLYYISIMTRLFLPEQFFRALLINLDHIVLNHVITELSFQKLSRM